ncbi:MAG: hypoxanthine phosphoribosyltransferase [Victivallales bacterium]|nr:hypoxanthine phosphoribosyltransferase [Victivallales bacterium]
METVVNPRVLVNEEKIRERVKVLGEKITNEYQGKKLTIICILKGCIPFVADLIRNIPIPFKVDVIHASSYINTKSSGKVNIHSEPLLNLKGRHVLLIDDILDTGKTLSIISTRIHEKHQPESIKFCVLLDKPSRRTENIFADYAGFEIPNSFVVGYGLDFNEYYRNLPYIGILNSDQC